MSGLQRTYQLLATTRNASVVDALALGLSDGSLVIRQMALSTLVARNEDRSCDLILQYWDRLGGEDLRQLEQRPDRMIEPVRRCLLEKRHLSAAIDACARLNLSALIDPLVTIAESRSDPIPRKSASRAVSQIAAALGSKARLARGLETVRSPVLLRLSESVRNFDGHHNERLIESFLMVCTWSDSRLRNGLGECSKTSELLLTILQKSEKPAVVSLLVGYLKRRNLPASIAEILKSRSDQAVGLEILTATGPAPGQTILKNLQTVGIPTSLSGGVQWLRNLPAEHHAAAIHIYTAGAATTPEVLQMILVAISPTAATPSTDSTSLSTDSTSLPTDSTSLPTNSAVRWRGASDVCAAAGYAMAHLSIPDEDRMLRAAAAVARFYERQPASADPMRSAIRSRSKKDAGTGLRGDACWLADLIELLDHPDAVVSAGVRRMLTPLHAETILTRSDELRRRTRRRLGNVVKRVDPAAVERVRDALRHPVLQRRLEAIITADALAIVELLSDSFTYIIRNDHQDARIRAAMAMSDATDDVSLELLDEMLLLPESQVRDAAEVALRRRRQTRPTFTTELRT